MKYLVCSVVLALSLNAASVEVTADKFFADEVKKISIFTGNVNVKKGNDLLVADKVVIEFNKNKEPIRYTASGNASVKMKINGKRYFGKGEILIYEPQKLKYTIRKNAFLEELDTNKKVYGDNIFVDQANGHYEVDSKKDKPVKFIFQIQDKKN